MKFINRWIFPGDEIDHVGPTATRWERWGFEMLGVETTSEHHYLTRKAWSEWLYTRCEYVVAEAGLT